MFIRKNKIRIIILQPVDGATEGATRRVICPASLLKNVAAIRGFLDLGNACLRLMQNWKILKICLDVALSYVNVISIMLLASHNCNSKDKTEFYAPYATHCHCGIASGLGTGTGFQSSSINVLKPVAVSTIFSFCVI